MDPDASWSWVLRLCGELDAALEDARPLDADAVYALVGLVSELDHWFCAGGRTPTRWRNERASPTPVLSFEGSPSNDALPTSRRRRRAVIARTRRHVANDAQLVLPFETAG